MSAAQKKTAADWALANPDAEHLFAVSQYTEDGTLGPAGLEMLTDAFLMALAERHNPDCALAFDLDGNPASLDLHTDGTRFERVDRRTEAGQ